jgi:hypothetical protein
MVAFLLIQTVALAMLLISNPKKRAAFHVVLSASVMQNVYFFIKMVGKLGFSIRTNATCNVKTICSG